MRDVVLHGMLGSRYGRKFQLDVVSLADAMRALGAQLAGFRKIIHDNNYRVILRRAGKDVLRLDEQQIDMHLPKGDIHVVPVVQGAKKGGVGKIIAGVLIAAVSWWAGPGLLAANGALGSTLGAGGLGLTAGNGMLMGLGIAVAGLSQVLSPAEKSKKDTGNSDSFTLDGVMNVGEQGVAVPLIYGEIMITDPTPISAGMSTSNIPMGAVSAGSATVGGVIGWTN